MILDRLAIAGLAWTAAKAVTMFDTRSRRPRARMPDPIVERGKIVDPEYSAEPRRESLATTPPVDPQDVLAPSGDLLHELGLLDEGGPR